MKNLNQQEKKKNQKKILRNYYKYTSIAIQMIAIILIGVFGGMKLDELFKTKYPIFTIICIIIAVIFSIYYVIKDLLKTK